MCYPTFKMGNVKCRTLYIVTTVLYKLTSGAIWQTPSKTLSSLKLPDWLRDKRSLLLSEHRELFLRCKEVGDWG